MLLIAIVDDERSDSSALKALVDTYFQQNRQAYMIHVFNGALDFIRSTENHDIVFMDIRMDKLDGLEVARIMRKINTDSVLIFVTHMAQLAIKGYEVDALDFIVKPVTYQDFAMRMRRAIERAASNARCDIRLRIPNGFYMTDSSRLMYIEVSGHNLIYHMTDDTLTARGSMTDLENQLAPMGFLRCNACYLVNPRHICVCRTWM